MNADEVGLLVAVATHVRHGVKREYFFDLLHPSQELRRDRSMAFELARLVKDFEAKEQPLDAAAVMVWLLTLRCASAPDLTALGRELWKELGRGFPHVASSASTVETTGKTLNVDGHNQIPEGLQPKHH